jgi:EAL domain-containing protein (putative c-di-GMP-specific phosphodiesterase class I)
VLLPSITGGADAESVAMRLIESLQGPVKVGDREVRVTVRAGIAMFPQDGTAAEPLLESALSAMEDARNGHSSPYKFHSGTVKLRALQRKDLELELKGALDREGFSLDYLPIVDARTERIACVEALLRWPQALFGAQSIHKVVALAEYTGLIAPIGDWVMRRSIEQLRQWHEAGHADLRLSINLSGQQFARLDCVKRLAEILTTHAIDPGYVDVEITEYMLFRDAMKDYAVSKAFREHGFGVIVDDYGTGACSLAHFARSPVAGIKIDNGFVSSMTTHADERAACAAMTVMAHELKRKVIAEGVETAAQAEILKAQGCDFLQGFLFSKPMPARAATEFLAAGMREPRSGR